MGSRCAVFRWTMCRGVPSEGIRRARMWRPMLGNWEGGGNKMADVDCVGKGLVRVRVREVWKFRWVFISGFGVERGIQR